jgi:hypothetical protein
MSGGLTRLYMPSVELEPPHTKTVYHHALQIVSEAMKLPRLAKFRGLKAKIAPEC